MASVTAPPDVARRLLAGLDPQQALAVTTDAAPLAVIAAAGSGKTTVLTRRIAHRVAGGTADAARVLALTFTRDAAGELRRRLRHLAIEQPVEAGTFHSVALRLLTDRALAANTPPPQVAPDRLRLVRECITELRLGLAPAGALADIDWARARLVPAEGYGAACRLARRRSAVVADRFAELADAYERLKRRRGVIDFDDLLAQVVQAMRTDEQWGDALRWRYRHFFVDEVQDLNPLQHAMLEALRGGRADLCLVGDPRQAIYAWNGAEPRLLTEVEQTYPGITIVRLGSNYRCTPQVVRAGAAVLAAAGQSDDTRSERPEGTAVAVHRFADAAAEAKAIATHVRGLVASRSAADVAVLARTNEQLSLIERALATAGVAAERATGRSALDRTLAATHRMSRERLAEWVEAVFADRDTRDARDTRDTRDARHHGGRRCRRHTAGRRGGRPLPHRCRAGHVPGVGRRAQPVRRSPRPPGARRGGPAYLPRRQGPRMVGGGRRRRRRRPGTACLGHVCGTTCRGSTLVVRRPHPGRRAPVGHPQRVTRWACHRPEPVARRGGRAPGWEHRSSRPRRAGSA